MLLSNRLDFAGILARLIGRLALADFAVSAEDTIGENLKAQVVACRGFHGSFVGRADFELASAGLLDLAVTCEIDRRLWTVSCVIFNLAEGGIEVASAEQAV